MSTARQDRGRPPALPQSRAARAVGAVVAALATTSGGHLLSTGVTPSLIGLLLAAAVMAAPAWLLTRDERGWERLAAAQLIAQLAGHALFTATAGDPAAHAGHGGFASDLVLLAHVLGAVVAAAWLRGGERRAIAAGRRAAAALCRLVGTLLGASSDTAPRHGSRWPGTPTAGDVTAVRLRYSIVHRGPPAVC